MTSETVAARQTVTGSMSATTTTTYTTYGYGVGTGAGYALGAVVTIDADTWQGGSDSAVPDTRTTYGYEWFDGAVQSSIEYRPDMSNSTIYNTGFGLTGSGQVASASIADGRPRSVAFTLDAYGQAVRRDEADNNTNLGDPHQVWYRFNGRQMGTIGNDTLEDNDYAGSIAARQVKQGTGPFRGGQDYGGGFARFGEAYVPYTSYAQGSGGGSYSADGGETLSQLAAQIWGDASLWYLLAEANGMGSDASLIQGQAITIPQGVTRNANTATTFKPFDPAETLGNLNPTTPKPQKKARNCGAFGAILMVAVAVAVVAILRVPVTNLIAFGTTAPAGAAGVAAAAAAAGVAVPTTAAGAAALAGTAATIAGGAIAGAAGSIASQGFGVAAGIQDKFNWKGVALAGISGGISGGLAGTGAFNSLGKVAGAGLRGALANAATQGIGLATGLQSRFDFAGVAAAGAGATAGAWMGGKLNAGPLSDLSARNIAANVTTSTAAALANAASRSLLNGTDFGDNILAALPDVIGQTIGQMVADGLAGGARETSFARRRREGWGPEIAQNVPDPNVRSDTPTGPSLASYEGGTPVDTPPGEEPSITVIGRTHRGFFDWVDSWAGTNLGGHNPHIRSSDSYSITATFGLSNFFRPSSRSEIARATSGMSPDNLFNGSQAWTVRSWVLQRRFADNVSGLVSTNFGAGTAADRYVWKPGAKGLGIAYQYTIGPGTPVDTAIVQPSYSILGLIAQTPLGDAGTIATLESNGLTAPIGALGAGVRQLVNLRGAAAAEEAGSRLAADRIAGNAFRDDVAEALRAAGRGVETEVYKKTPFGPRYMDIEVRDVPGGKVIGGVETKLGGSRYTPSQQAKDNYLRIWEKYPVDILRSPR